MKRLPLALLYVGLALTVVAAVLPFAARDVLEEHIRDGYPSYSAAELDSAVTGWLSILAILGALGVVGWLVSIRAVRRQRRARLTATTLLAVGLALSLTAALAEDTSGEVGLAPLLGAFLLLPCVAGAIAVVLLWMDERSGLRDSSHGRPALGSPLPPGRGR